ncbi:hypothetical protein [Treponema pectinovorum]|uniref:hypothetical protein n=1 Tax=Treponema pectinovorum TaxID=164 RepID=UPI0011C75873|nr:hypothetical protein [Treponema pectinovorum]
MTETEKEQRRYALAVSGGVCEVCKKPLLDGQAQGAHRIGNTKMNRIKYGDFVIDHRLNLGYVCSLKCNASLDISKNTGEVIFLCKTIYEEEAKKYEVQK